MPRRETRPLSLYIHVPFCRARCLYCSFATRPAGPSTQTRYIENLATEIKGWFSSNRNYSVKTVYVGGGTPSTLGSGDICLLLETIRTVAPDASEITFEVNPNPEDMDKLPGLLNGGVNRLSVGIQSFDNDELETAGRLHTRNDAHKFLSHCRESGVKNLSIDLIHGLPGQTVDSFNRSLDEAINVSPDHISLYGLSIDPTCRMARLPEKQISSLNIPGSDTQAEMYGIACNRLRENGYRLYELSNFSKPGHECQHNIVYWSGKEYIGFGPGATSYVDGTRFRRIEDVDTYLDAQAGNKNTIEFLENLSTGRAAAEALVMGLRLADGIDSRSIETRFGVKLTDLVGEALRKYEREGLLEIDKDNIRLTDRAYFVSNSIFSDLIL